jgi:uncharacterized protein (DUF2147 family)
MMKLREAIKGMGLILYLSITGVGATTQTDQLEGKWQDVKNPEKVVSIVKQASGLQGYGVSVKAEDNGKPVFKDLQWNSGINGYKGFLINPDNGEQIPVNVLLKDKDHFRFEVKVLFMTRSFQFKRIHP